MIAVHYRGTKVKRDIVTGQVWAPGSTKDLTDEQAKKLVGMGKDWELVAPPVIEPQSKYGEKLGWEEPMEESDRVVHNINLATMTKAELNLYAKREFNKWFDDDVPIQQLRSGLRQLRIGAGIRNG
jgi:hypothetical protein